MPLSKSKRVKTKRLPEWYNDDIEISRKQRVFLKTRKPNRQNIKNTEIKLSTELERQNANIFQISLKFERHAKKLATFLYNN